MKDYEASRYFHLCFVQVFNRPTTDLIMRTKIRGRNKDRLAHLRGSGCDAGENEEDEEEDTDVDAEVDADGEAEQES